MIPEWMWVLWILGVPTTFGILEYIAIRNGHGSTGKPADTLSEVLREWFRVHTKRGAFSFLVFLASLQLLLLWLAAHIIEIGI